MPAPDCRQIGISALQNGLALTARENSSHADHRQVRLLLHQRGSVNFRVKGKSVRHIPVRPCARRHIQQITARAFNGGSRLQQFAIVRIPEADRNDKIPAAGVSDLTDQLSENSDAVFKAAAVLIRTLVGGC